MDEQEDDTPEETNPLIEGPGWDEGQVYYQIITHLYRRFTRNPTNDHEEE